MAVCGLRAFVHCALAQLVDLPAAWLAQRRAQIRHGARAL